MTTSSTAFVMVGPSGVGSFHDRLWRVNPNSAQLVEGGGNGPYILLDSGDQEFSFPIEAWDAGFVMKAVVLLVTLLVGEEQTTGILRETENLIQTERGERVAPFWDIAEDVLPQLTRRLAPLCRIGIVRLESNSILSRGVVDLMRQTGFDVETFENIDAVYAAQHD